MVDHVTLRSPAEPEFGKPFPELSGNCSDALYMFVSRIGGGISCCFGGGGWYGLHHTNVYTSEGMMMFLDLSYSTKSK